MTRWLSLLILLAALPAFAADKKDKKDKKKDQKAAVVVAGPDELMQQAEAKASAGDAAGAAELLREAAALPAGDGRPALRLGRLLEDGGELDAAIDAYRQAAEKSTAGPAKGEALGRLAVAQALRGMAADSAASADAAQAADPEGLWPVLAQARRRASEGKAEEAIALAQKAAAAGGGPAASVALGLAQEAAGSLDAAEAAYRSAVADASQRLPATLGLARVLRKTGRAAEAEPMLAKLQEDAPGAVGVYKESARVRMALGKAMEAMGDAVTAAALAEDDVEAQRLVQETTVAKALTWLPKNQPDLAIQELTALRDQHPDLAAARVGLGRAHIAKRQADAALAELQKAVELDPGSAEAQYYLGFVQHRMKGDPGAAAASLEKAVAAEPGSTEYRTALGAALVDAKQFDAAVAALERVTATPGYASAEAWIHLGAAHLGAKRYKEAAAALSRAVEIAPETPQAEAYLAWAHFGLKDAKAFVEHAKKAKALGHDEQTLLAYLKRVEGGEAIK